MKAPPRPSDGRLIAPATEVGYVRRRPRPQIRDLAGRKRPIKEPRIIPLERSRGLPAELLALNNRFQQELSFLSPEKAAQLIGQAFMASRIGEDALLLAFDQDARYDNPNFNWFRERFDRFVYIDRVVVAPHKRGRGLAQALYRALFRQAASVRHVRVVCEINWEPPNPASDAFHAGLGFEQVGLAILPGAAKTVRYFSRAIV